MSRRMLCFAVLPASLALAAGIRPRPAATDYPAHGSGAGVTVAATVIPPDQVSKLFSADVNKMGYVVVEVAVYPDADNEVDIHSRDFLLRAGSGGATVRPVSAQVIASRMDQKHAPKAPQVPGNVHVYTESTIGYETGGYDPATGRRGSGVYTGTAVGVGIGQPPMPPPPPAGPDAGAAQLDLVDQGLPEVKTIAPVAGYLYFPKPDGWKTKGTNQLTYYGEHGQVRLEIPAPKK